MKSKSTQTKQKSNDLENILKEINILVNDKTIREPLCVIIKIRQLLKQYFDIPVKDQKEIKQELPILIHDDKFILKFN